MGKTVAHFSPGRVVLLFTFITILLGTLLLALPIARKVPISWLDLFFTSASTTTVTGIFTIPLNQFTTFGHWVILFLMQIGGLGLITLTLFTLYLLFDLGFGAQLLAGQIFEIESWKEIKKILMIIVIFTVCAEIIGTFFTFFSIKEFYPTNRALFLSLFHSVSSFCNAGISLFDQSHTVHLSTHYGLLIVTAALMFSGSFGFITWLESFRFFWARFRNRRYAMSLVSKLVIYATIFLIIIPALLLLILESNNAFAHLSSVGKLINAFFTSISMRSTGLLTVPIAEFQMASLLLILVVSFIGAAPASTGSGIKISTFMIILAIIRATINGQSSVNIKGRRIPKDQVLKSVTIAALSLFWLIGSLFCLLITQTNADFLDITVETVSAVTNLGLTTGLTPTLVFSSKFFIIISMIIGRIGSLTLILALLKQRLYASETISFPEERVMLS